jgi:hypothetical protein
MYVAHAALSVVSRAVDAYSYVKGRWFAGVVWLYARYFDGQVMSIRHIDMRAHRVKAVYDVFRPTMFPRFLLFRALPWPVYNYGLVADATAPDDADLYECVLCHKGALLTAFFRPGIVTSWIDPDTDTIDHAKASEVMLTAVSQRHRVDAASCVAELNGVDVTTVLLQMLPSLGDKNLTAAELYHYMRARHEVPEVKVEEVRLNVMDLDSLEESSFVGCDAIHI